MIKNINAKEVVLQIISEIEKNKQWLSEIDGRIGDGDHGVNMAKGLDMVKDELDEKPNELSDLFRTVGMTLITHIGGAMGPIYGTFFIRIGKAVEGKKSLAKEDVLRMLTDGLDGIMQRGGAEVGDKTLVDTLSAAKKGYEQAISAGKDMGEALDVLKSSAKEGMEKTKDLVAKKGRSSRLGERSRGTIDAGAASCYLILKAIVESFKRSL